MIKLRTLLLFSTLSLAACSADAHPLAGNWAQETGTDAKGITLAFNGAGDDVRVHADENGEHVHRDGTYTFDAESKAVTVKGEILGKGKGDAWAGKLADGHLELGSADTKLKFARGSDPHGH